MASNNGNPSLAQQTTQQQLAQALHQSLVHGEVSYLLIISIIHPTPPSLPRLLSPFCLLNSSNLKRHLVLYPYQALSNAMNNPTQSSINSSSESSIHGRLNESPNSNPETLNSQSTMSMPPQTTQLMELMKQAEAQKNQSNGNS